nr:hypothetical protein [Tanacetum cinerariifolium]
MAALIISISLDVSVESVESSFLRVILIGSISVEVSVAPEVRVATVALPVRVIELDTYSSSEADPSESLPPPVSVAPMDIPIGLLYRTHPGGPCKALTVRKSVRPLPSHHLASRFVYPSLFKTPQCSEAYFHWRSASLSTMYPLMTFESPAGDFSSESSARPSRKRCRSPAATVILSIHDRRALVPSCADLLLPRKRFRDSISPEDCVEDDIDTDVLEDIKADTTAVEVTLDRDVEAGIDADIGMKIYVRIDVEDKVESSNRGIMEDWSLERENLKVRALLCIERDRVDSLHRHMALSQEKFRQTIQSQILRYPRGMYHLLLLLQRFLLLPFYPHHLLLLHHHLSFHLHLLLPYPGSIDGELSLSDPGRTFLLVDFIVLILVGHTPQCSEAYFHWRSASLSTMYPLMTFESPAGDFSSESSSRPSRKRCRSPAATVILSIHDRRALVPSCADLLLPRKRFRDSISPEDCVDEDIDTNVLEDIKADTTAVEVTLDRDVEAGIDADIGMKIYVGIDVEDKVESSDRGIMEVRVDMDAGIDIPNCMLMPDAIEHLEQDWSLERENLKVRALLCIERDRVDSLRRHMALSQEKFRQVCKDRDDNRMRLRRLESFVERHLGFRP